MKDVAELAGVSIASVSHVINKTRRVDPKTKDVVLAAIEQLNYRPNMLARSLRGKDSHSIGVIIADIREEFFEDVVKSIESRSREHGYTIILCDSEDNAELERLHIEQLLLKGVDGFILSPVNQQEDYNALVHNRVPYVQIDRRSAATRADFIGIDNAGSAEELTSWLIQQGARNIVFFGYARHVFTQDERYKGFARAAASAAEKVHADVFVIEYHASGRSHLISDYLVSHPDVDAVVCGTSSVCYEVIDAVDRLKLSVPGDLRIFTYDDSKWFDFLRYPVNAIVQPTDEIGTIAVEQIMEHIKKGHGDTVRRTILSHNTVIRSD